MTKRLQINTRTDSVTLELLDALSDDTGFNKSEIVKMSIATFAEKILGNEKVNRITLETLNRDHQERLKILKEKNNENDN